MAAKIKMECMECGKKFSVSPKNSDPRCPKCHGVDVDVDFDQTEREARMANVREHNARLERLRVVGMV